MGSRAGSLPSNFGTGSRNAIEAARQQAMKHFSDAYGGVLDPDEASDLLDRIVRAADDPDEIARILREAGDELDSPLASLVSRMIRLGATKGDLAFLPVQSLVKTGRHGIEGFKAPPELDMMYQRWVSTLDDTADTSAEAFIRQTRAGVIAQGSPPVFADNVLQKRYVEYVKRRAGNNNPSPADFAQHSPDAYLKAVSPNGRPRAILDGLFGPAVRDVIEATPRKVKRWNNFFPRETLAAPSSFKATLQGYLGTDTTALYGKIDDLYKLRYPGTNQAPDDVKQWIFDALQHHLDEAAGDPDAALDLLCGQKTMRKGIHPDEFLHRLMDAEDILENTVRNAGFNVSQNRMEDIRRIPGMFDLVQKVMTRSGYEKGYVFELELIIETLEEGLEEGDRLVLQLILDHKDGPDMIILRGGRAIIKQAKSFNRLSSISGFYGGGLKQMGSDLRRIIADSDARRLAEGLDPDATGTWPQIKAPGIDGTYTVDNVFTFILDKSRIKSPHPRPLSAAEFADEFGPLDRVSDFGVVRGQHADPDFLQQLANLPPDQAMQYGTRLYRDVDLDPTWLRQAIADEAAERVKINQMFDKKTVSIADDPDALASILAGSSRRLKNSDETLASKITDAIRQADQAGEPLKVSEVMALRMLVDAEKGLIDSDMIALARRIGQLSPSPRLDVELKAPASTMAFGTNWDPRLKGLQGIPNPDADIIVEN